MLTYKLSSGIQSSNLNFQPLSSVNSREVYLAVRDADEDSKWIGMEEAGWDSCRTTKEARVRGHLRVTFSIMEDLHDSHDRVSGLSSIMGTCRDDLN